jgi:hypothetical protein
MEAKFTPGPWQMDDEGQIFSDGTLVATVNPCKYPGEDVWDWDTAGANGLLICAASDLLDGCIKALAAWEGSGPAIDLDDLRAAIQKATGATS